jgi:DNA-binding NtrC family response regulator
MDRILIIEDEEVIRQAVKRLLERHDYNVEVAESLEDAESNHDLNGFRLIITDVRLPGAPGTDILTKVEDVPVLIMTSYATVRSAVDAMKLGAVDYIAKPFDHDELVLLIERTLDQDNRQRQQATLKSDMEQCYPVRGMVGQCPAMNEVRSKIEKVAPTDATVLILGESGTGKELVARALHERSRRSNAPFVVFNCAAVPEHQIEKELFGQAQETKRNEPGLLHKATGGTLFLDEIGELPPVAQARLLRLLQSNHDNQSQDSSDTMDVRILAATHRDIRKLIQEQRFRSDLYFRLRVVEMTLPPLRERGDDIRELSLFLLDKACKQLNRSGIEFSRTAMEAIRRYHWPGNVRELGNSIERAVILCENELITPDLLAIDHSVGTKKSMANNGDNLSLEEYFRQFVLEHQDHMTETEMAKKLGISRKALWERRQRFGIPRPTKHKP